MCLPNASVPPVHEPKRGRARADKLRLPTRSIKPRVVRRLRSAGERAGGRRARKAVTFIIRCKQTVPHTLTVRPECDPTQR